MYGYYREKDFFSGILVGGAVATLACLLVTTKKGKEIQRQVGSWIETAEDEIKEGFSTAKEKVEESVDEVENTISRYSKKDCCDQCDD